MSWYYSDAEYTAKLKEERKSINKHLRDLDRLEKYLLKRLWIPVWDKQGMALIDPKKHGAWKRAVRWNSTSFNMEGEYLKDALHIMLAIEAHGIEAGLKELEYVDFYKIGPIDIVDKFYHRGHEFARAAMEAHPEWVKQNPKLSKYLEQQDAPVSKEENERRSRELVDALEFTKKTAEALNLRDVDQSRVYHSVKYMEEIVENQSKENKNSNKR